MGKRKAAKKPGKKAKLQPLDKIFRCLFCQQAGAVHCKLDRQEMVSRIECSRCAQWFETKIDHLTEPIDVYSLWIDATEQANRPQANASSSAHRTTNNHREERERPTSTRNTQSADKQRGHEAGAGNDYDPFEEADDDHPEDLPDDLF
ncbi:uncharacterized protein MELLADRAFT_77929 [Melampsora larici-populina 98AG31]|uniref:Transcription elongation factor 1 homolog n=1 Tax=Melampsora larici-populina (strain 98AG31 / pathotype 3-4-7) TaxID=747676 RepID=F4RNK2_MELLP|nr:uncharacterized protein MELLADRAFT_77929 [Melampsora larici-populina 98AG31]EGG06001.1 hypothetical protein MELLADRAFT_77929 [Melampsora larici-populina 98AG31]